MNKSNMKTKRLTLATCVLITIVITGFGSVKTGPMTPKNIKDSSMRIKHTFLTVLLILLFSPGSNAQTDREQIATLRQASNAALRSYDINEVLSCLTEDALTTTGNGTVLCGKEELRNYILAGPKSKMYWIRDTQEITVNAKRGLAWESGVWNGYDPETSDQSIISGKYSAQWTKASGTWKIKSQLFVTLEEK